MITSYFAGGSSLTITTDVVSNSEFELLLRLQRESNLHGEGACIIEFKTLCYGTDIPLLSAIPYEFTNSLGNIQFRLAQVSGKDTLSLALRPNDMPEIGPIRLEFIENVAHRIAEHLSHLRNEIVGDVA